MAGGFASAAGGFLLTTRVTPQSSIAVVLIGARVLGVGLVTVMTLVTEIAMGAIDPARAGSASAVLETASEFGGALGIAVLGSIGAAIYGSAMEARAGRTAPMRLPRRPAKRWPGATVVAPQFPGRRAPAVLAAARDVFATGMHGVGIVGAMIMVAAGAICLVTLRRAAMATSRR